MQTFVQLYLTGEELFKPDPILDACTDAYRELDEDAQVSFKSAAKAFVRTYGFLGAILPMGNAEWEKLHIFLTFLVPKLPSPKEEDLSTGILEAIDLDSYRGQAKIMVSISLNDEDAEVDPVPSSTDGVKPEPELDLLSNVLSSFNDIFCNIAWIDEGSARRQIEELPTWSVRTKATKTPLRIPISKMPV